MFKCEMCDATFEYKDWRSPECRDWDWFTGYLGRTHHYCPKHKNSPERNEMFKLSYVKPPPPEVAE